MCLFLLLTLPPRQPHCPAWSWGNSYCHDPSCWAGPWWAPRPGCLSAWAQFSVLAVEKTCPCFRPLLVQLADHLEPPVLHILDLERPVSLVPAHPDGWNMRSAPILSPCLVPERKSRVFMMSPSSMWRVTVVTGVLPVQPLALILSSMSLSLTMMNLFLTPLCGFAPVRQDWVWEGVHDVLSEKTSLTECLYLTRFNHWSTQFEWKFFDEIIWSDHSVTL